MKNRSNGPSGNPGGHNNQRRGFVNKNRVLDSNGPDVRIRGTAHQIVEKYNTLAKDAFSSGDRVLAESYLQHAEHYQRLVNAMNEEFGAEEFIRDEHSNPYQRFDVPPPAGTVGSGVQTQKTGETAEDLALPASILGARPNAAPSEMAEA
jgi:hypothetical protein